MHGETLLTIKPQPQVGQCLEWEISEQFAHKHGVLDAFGTEPAECREQVGAYQMGTPDEQQGDSQTAYQTESRTGQTIEPAKRREAGEQAQTVQDKRQGER